MSETPKLYAALVSAQAAVRPVEKDSTNSFHKYKYASGDDVIASARAALNGAGLAVFATRWTVTETPIEWTDENGKLFKDVSLRLAVHFRAVHDSGESIDFEPFGVPVLPEKGRPIDKAEAGARTYALSYFLRDLLLIPRVDEGADVDARDDRERDTRRGPAAKAPAPRNDDRQSAAPPQARGEAAQQPAAASASAAPAASEVPKTTAQQVCARLVTQIRDMAGQTYEGRLRAEVTNLLNDTDPLRLDTETAKALLGTTAAPGPLRALRDRVQAGPQAPASAPAAIPTTPERLRLITRIASARRLIAADYPAAVAESDKLVGGRMLDTIDDAALAQLSRNVDAVYECAAAKTEAA